MFPPIVGVITAAVICIIGLFILTQSKGSMIGFALVIIGLVFLIKPAWGRDLGQWENGDPVVRRWYQSLMQPDNPSISCCGESDAYWCDGISVKDGKTFCTITDDRDDAPLRRPHIPMGTVVEIPNHKLKFDKGNPTGHAIVFMTPSGYVHCFVQNGGV